MTHEATHAAQQCNNNFIVSKEKLINYLNESNIPNNFSNNYKEVEAYYYQDKPTEVKELLEKHCFKTDIIIEFTDS